MTCPEKISSAASTSVSNRGAMTDVARSDGTSIKAMQVQKSALVWRNFIRSNKRTNQSRRNAPAQLQLLRRLRGLNPDRLIRARRLLHTDGRLAARTWPLDGHRGRASGRVGQRRFNAENFQLENERRGRRDF